MVEWGGSQNRFSCFGPKQLFPPQVGVKPSTSNARGAGLQMVRTNSRLSPAGKSGKDHSVFVIVTAGPVDPEEGDGDRWALQVRYAAKASIAKPNANSNFDPIWVHRVSGHSLCKKTDPISPVLGSAHPPRAWLMPTKHPGPHTTKSGPPRLQRRS